jgi:hypothetical protein
MNIADTLRYRAARRAYGYLWKEASTLTGLGELTALWLEGAITYQPGYIGDPSPETRPLTGYLAAYNRAGLFTTRSQPATESPTGAQRAWVSAFCAETALDAVVTHAARAGLVTVCAAPGEDSALELEVTHHGGLYTTFAVPMAAEYIDGYYAADCPAALDAIKRAWRIDIIDLVWGRNDVLWDCLAAALNATVRARP